MALTSLLAVLALAAAGASPALRDAVLPDQRGGEDHLAAHLGRPVVVLVVDARRLGSIRRWAEDLVTGLPGTPVLTIADVNEGRPVTLERVAAVLARRVPPEATVLIDMERLWAREFALDTSAPNVLVLDGEGMETGRFRGRWSEDLAAEVRRRVAGSESAT